MEVYFMDHIYVTGHRNPDTDSIVAAIAYTALRNACGDREYQAACLGRVSDETHIVLDRFGFQPPTRITDLCLSGPGFGRNPYRAGPVRIPAPDADYGPV